MNQQPQQGSGCGKEEPQDLSDIESQRKSEAPLAAPDEVQFVLKSICFAMLLKHSPGDLLYSPIFIPPAFMPRDI